MQSEGFKPATVQRVLIIAGIALFVLGILWPWIRKLGFGRLPGDIVIEREGFHFYFPVTTMILLSIVVSIVIYFLKK